MNRQVLHVSASIMVALIFHLLLVLAFWGPLPEGAQAQGVYGIEIDLGLLGELGDSVSSSEKKETTPLPQNKALEKRQETPVQEKNVQEKPVEDVAKLVQKSDFKERIETVNQAVSSQTEDVLTDPVNDISPPDETILVDALAKDLTQLNESPIAQEKQQTTGESEALTAGGQMGLDQGYLARLLAQLSEHKRYPFSSRKLAEEGITILDFEINRSGKVLMAQIQKSSGYPALDAAVLSMLRRAEPLPPVPPDIKGEAIRLTLPIAFRLNG